ncbi:MAG: 16S rRNA (cytosine(1402)-N(4))-methyltransferase RsmH [Gammaproteobacteria bacterium]|nr:16S rRNA (cytosine(1402)-N(4))-methyltransferase RsmH [Gammaproteobacteria bacterium]
MKAESVHETVLIAEAIEALAIRKDGTYVDATFGRGGHSRLILEHLGPKGSLIIFDKDPEAIEVARIIGEKDERLQIAHAPFGDLEEQLTARGLSEGVDGILFDLGVSSPQLDNADRGFSFLRDGPLDMRMNPEAGQSAEQWINSATEIEIADVLYQYGEERHSRRMARRVILERAEKRITRTGELAEIIKEANPAWERDKHPATRAFQGIRIFINDELGELERGLEQALKMLKVGGRLVAISFHSLEDRMVKRFIAKQAKGDNYPRGLPISQDMLSPKLNPIGKRIKASAVEVDRNPRSRSAVMRVAEKIAQ